MREAGVGRALPERMPILVLRAPIAWLGPGRR